MQSPQHQTRILIVDDHPLLCRGIAELINQEADLVVCGQANGAPTARQLVRSLRPDLAIIDLALGHSDGLELMKDVHVQCPDLPVLILSMYQEIIYADRALRAGARGYIMKRETSEQVIAAIRHVLRGRVYVSDAMSDLLLRRSARREAGPGQSPVAMLSDRELQVFQRIGNGHGTGEIARELHLSVKTVEYYQGEIKAKLGLATAADLRQYAIQHSRSCPDR